MLQVTIESIINETPASKTFVLRTSEPFTYEAGQFITFIFQSKEKEIRRSYSFSSAPGVDSLPAITIKKNDNGAFSRWWIEEARSGDTLNAQGPSGVFTVSHVVGGGDFYFTAAGSGITPIFSIIKWVLHTDKKRKLHLVYSNRNKATAIFYDALINLEKDHPHQFSIDWFFSENPDLLSARLGTYNLQRIILSRTPFINKDAYMFSCGPFDYMKMVQITWLTMGFSPNNFKRELYDLDIIPGPFKKYFDKKNRMVIIQIRENKIPILVHWNETILDAALRNGIQIPFNCRAGICSTCTCKIITGKVWMHYNEVLTNTDEERGLFLACTAHPVTENLEIIPI